MALISKFGLGAMAGGALAGALYGRNMGDEYTSSDRRTMRSLGGAAMGAVIAGGGAGLIRSLFTKAGATTAAKMAFGTTKFGGSFVKNFAQRAGSMIRRHPREAAMLGGVVLAEQLTMKGAKMASNRARRQRITKFQDSASGDVVIGAHRGRHR